MLKNKFALIGVFATFAIVLSGCSLFQGFYSENGSEEVTIQDSTGIEAKDSVTVSYTDDGFDPPIAKVKAGGMIIWVNDSSRLIQVGSDTHPTHTINKEITKDQFVVELAPGESSDPVKVTKIGQWGYHDHLRASETGEVIVE